MQQLTEKLYQLMIDRPFLAAEIMQSGNHSREELIGLVNRFDEQHAENSLLDKLRWAFAFDVSKREIINGFGLDFLMPILTTTETVHICIMLEKIENYYYLRFIDIRSIKMKTLTYCPPARFTGLALKQEQVLNGKLLVSDTGNMTAGYVEKLHEQFSGIYYAFIVDYILGGNLLD